MSISGGQTLTTRALFPGADACRDVTDLLSTALQGSLQRVKSGPVGPTLDFRAFREALDGFDFSAPRDLRNTLTWIIDQLEHGVVHVTHPRYFGLFNPNPAFPAECADRIVAAFNPQLASSKTSPVPVEIEAHVIRAVGRRAGFPSDSGGHFTNGGSEANFTALVCALTCSTRFFAQDGLRAFDGQPLLYISEYAHGAWYKIAHQCGIGRSSVRVVPADRFGRMDAGALREMIAADRALGRVPVLIVATAGTTGAGMVDPLPACAEIARQERVWLHVDAAWGGAVIVSDRLRRMLAGIEDATSFSFDAHKWLATTMGCGVFLTRRPDVLADTFHASADFMPSNVPNLDPYVTSVQWSRRFLGLRLFLSLAAAGWQGFADHIERSIRMAELLKDELTARGWKAINDSEMAILCLDPPPGFPAVTAIASKIVDSKLSWVSATHFLGRDVVRICVTNGQTSRDDVLALVRLLQASREPTMNSKKEVTMAASQTFEYRKVITEICELDWRSLESDDMVSAAWAYYHFSVQFRENLQIAIGLYPEDDKLQQLATEECDTDNLSPWPGVAGPGEKMNHDEFMRRTLDLVSLEPDRARGLVSLGQSYLAATRSVSPRTRAASIASYEDGGLEAVFRAMLTFRDWNSPLLAAFEHFLSEHVRFDSDPDQGHGALSRHMEVNDCILPLWEAFRDVLVASVPKFAHRAKIREMLTAAE